MDLVKHFQRLAQYNRLANERLYEKCAELDDAEYRKPRQGSFGSIHALLNHVMLADRVWMGRFEGTGRTTPSLDTILAEEFSALREARVVQDARIESFFGAVQPDFFDRLLLYTNSRGVECRTEPALAVTQLFNHQTHHRGQVHVMLSQTPVAPPALDVIRLIPA